MSIAISGKLQLYWTEELIESISLKTLEHQLTPYNKSIEYENWIFLAKKEEDLLKWIIHMLTALGSLYTESEGVGSKKLRPADWDKNSVDMSSFHIALGWTQENKAMVLLLGKLGFEFIFEVYGPDHSFAWRYRFNDPAHVEKVDLEPIETDRLFDIYDLVSKYKRLNKILEENSTTLYSANSLKSLFALEDLATKQPRFRIQRAGITIEEYTFIEPVKHLILNN
jgi:hypothetical protein